MAEGSTQPPNATRFVETTRGILSYAQLAPLLAERVLRVQEDIEDSAFADNPLDEHILQELHRRICGDLIPDWAGRFRLIDVQVGQHSPPPRHLVPGQIREYSADLAVRMQDVPSDMMLLETLAFAEGRLLSIHPFTDFNGRITRLFLCEILRRLNLPPVELAPSNPDAALRYLSALRSGDRLDWGPLVEFWKSRLENA